jgi:SET domain-containing protein
MSLQQGAIFVAPSDLHGLGVFAARDMEAEEIIEVCPVIVFPRKDLEHIDKTVLYDYYFDWGDDGEWYAFGLGYASLYNHSVEPNAEYAMDFEAKTIDIFCLKPIAAGEEILINYNGDPENRGKVWFEP